MMPVAISHLSLLFFVFQDESNITRETFCLSQYAEMLKTFLKANAKNSTDFFYKLKILTSSWI